MSSAKEILLRELLPKLSTHIKYRSNDQTKQIYFYVDIDDVQIGYMITETMLGTCEDINKLAKHIQTEIQSRIK